MHVIRVALIKRGGLPMRGMYSFNKNINVDTSISSNVNEEGMI